MGDWVFTAGNPFLLANDFQPSIAYGMVSGVHRYQYPAATLLRVRRLHSDRCGDQSRQLWRAAIRLLTARLIGINGRGSFEKRGRVNVGVGYAISINQIKHFLAHI